MILGSSWARSYSLVAFQPSSDAWNPSCIRVLEIQCICFRVPSEHSTLGCQEKQTPVPCSSPELGQSFVIRRSRGFNSFYSVPPSSITFFISRGRAEIHGLIDEVMLIHVCTHLLLQACMLGNVGCILMCVSDTHSNSYCFEKSKKHLYPS